MAVTTQNYAWPVPENPDPATIPADLKRLADPIDAKVAELEARVSAREKIFATHSGDGTWAFTDGLGEPVAVNDAGDGDWQVLS